jgi:hypothetical protein
MTACLKLLTRQIRAATISQAPTARVVLKTYPRKKFRICLADKAGVEHRGTFELKRDSANIFLANPNLWRLYVRQEIGTPASRNFSQ